MILFGQSKSFGIADNLRGLFSGAERNQFSKVVDQNSKLIIYLFVIDYVVNSPLYGLLQWI